jgi:hypothetical protein
MLAALAALGMLCVSGPAETRENRPLKCKTGKARGAKSVGGPALVANVPKSMTPIDLNAVQMTEKKLGKQMVVEGLFAQRTETDALQVTARLVNCTKSPLAVQARSSFMDANQIPTEPTSMWRTVFIPPLATGVYQERSIATDKVAAYLIELRSEQ